MKSDKSKPDSQQLSRFIATARALECDEDKARFEAALGKIASSKPAQRDKPNKPPSRRK